MDQISKSTSKIPYNPVLPQISAQAAADAGVRVCACHASPWQERKGEEGQESVETSCLARKRLVEWG